MRTRCKTRRRTFNRVTLAVYWLADGGGLICRATNAQIAAAARCSPDTVRSCLQDLQFDDSIAMSYGGGRGRVILLLDHPEAGDVIRARHATNSRANADTPGTVTR